MKVFQLAKYRIGIDAANGMLSISYGEHDIRRAHALVRYSIGDEVRELSLLGNPRQYVDEECTVLELTAADSAIHVRTLITGRSQDSSLEIYCESRLTNPDMPVRLLEIVPLTTNIKDTFLGSAAARDVLFRCQVPDAWTNAGNKRIDHASEFLEFATETSYVAGGYFHIRTGAGIFAYHVLPHQWINFVRNSNGRMSVIQKVDVPLRRSEVLQSDRLLLNLADPLNEALKTMAGHQKGRRRPDEVNQHIGWNNWDYYRENISHESIMSDVHAIKAIPWMRNRVKYIIIDGFWHNGVGEWEADLKKFPKGMEALAEEITKEGFVPGIWIGPFWADRNCKLLREHPEYAVQYNGEPYSVYKLIGCDPPFSNFCNLDPTHPAVQQFIYGQMQKLKRWGYKYFKTDFLVDPIRPLLDVSDWMIKKHGDKIDRSKFRFHDSDIGIARAHRACMMAIRAAIGEESFWLGCGTYIPSGAELMDGSRICQDITKTWPSVRWNSQSAIFSSHLHGTAYLIDPDFAIFRGPETMDVKQLDGPIEGTKPYNPDDVMSGPPLSEDEARQWASATILCGGLVTLSDRIGAMNDRGLAIIRKVIEYCGGNAAHAIDFAERVPSIWLKYDSGRYMLGLFNWDHDNSRSFNLNAACGVPLPEDGSLLEIWSGEEIRVADVLKLELPRRTVQIFIWNKGQMGKNQ